MSVEADPRVLEGLEHWRTLPVTQQPAWPDPEALARAAERAKMVGRPEATRDLADLVERTGLGADPNGADETVLRPVRQDAFA